MEERIPVLGTFVWDDDHFAQQMINGLLRRDLRAYVLAHTRSAGQLLRLVRMRSSPEMAAMTPRAARREQLRQGELHCIILDVETESRFELGDLVRQLRQYAPDAVILCLSQRRNPDALSAAVRNGADGYAIKRDVQYALATVLVRLWRNRGRGLFWITPRVSEVASTIPELTRERLRLLPAWKTHPSVQPRHLLVFPCLMVGMHPQSIAPETGLKPTAVAEYIQDLYAFYNDYYEVLDASEIHHIATLLDNAQRRERFFHFATLLPNG